MVLAAAPHVAQASVRCGAIWGLPRGDRVGLGSACQLNLDETWGGVYLGGMWTLSSAAAGAGFVDAGVALTFDALTWVPVLRVGVRQWAPRDVTGPTGLIVAIDVLTYTSLDTAVSVGLAQEVCSSAPSSWGVMFALWRRIGSGL